MSSRNSGLRLVDLLRAGRSGIAAAFTEAWYRRHPECDALWGARGRALTQEDAGYHLDFLAGALHLGSPRSFGDYIRWARRMLGARGLDAAVLDETLAILEELTGRTADEDQRALLHEMFSAGRDALHEEVPAVERSKAEGDLRALRDVYLQSILQGQRRAALNVVMEAIREGTRLEDIYTYVFQECLYDVGRLWEGGRISVAAEHMATAITQYVMARAYSQVEPTGEKRGNAVVTGVQGESHQVGAAMVADILEYRGWNVRFLGTNVPQEGILQAIEEHQPRTLGISATMLFNVPSVVRLVEGVHKKFGPARPRIVLGGAVFRAHLDLWKEIGADGFAADLAGAVAAIEATAE
jgi:methanogenic corrinoid protein MtbC1